MDFSSTPNTEDYSAAATTISFNRPLPLLRGPVPAGRSDCPESGPYVLAFKSVQSWATAFKRSQTLILEQCEEGARIGCAITASNKCKPPWWQSLMGQSSLTALKEREKCEEREMKGCVAAAREKCVGFAREKCSRPFLDARIEARGVGISSKQAEGLIWLASEPESAWRDLIGTGQLDSLVMESYGFGVTNYKARILFNYDSENGYVVEKS